MEKVQQCFIQIFLSCAFGIDFSNVKLDYYENGVKSQKPVKWILLNVDKHLIMRKFSL